MKMLRDVLLEDGSQILSSGKKYVATCPFHKGDREPSFTIYEDTDTYYCFGCGVWGDAVKFLIDYRHFSPQQATEYIGEEYKKVPKKTQVIKITNTVKTGTLTRGRAALARWHGSEAALDLARSLEEESAHAVAAAFVATAAGRPRAVRTVAGVREVAGQGIAGVVDGHGVLVGNRAHVVGYHLGRDRIYDGSGPGIGDRDYSVQLPRDKAGLSDAASAIDLGKLNGTLSGLRRFSRWLVAECLAHPTKYRDIREIIYSPDGVYVKRYSAVDGKVITSLRKNANGSITVVNPGNGDASHFTHTHISFYRDSVGRDKVPLFATGCRFSPALPKASVS